MTVARRGSITPDTNLQLWVRAGGRCEYCNVYLLEDAYSGYELNLAERAHIVGATDAPGSPRGGADLPLSERDRVDNLMLLCRAHHRVIDHLIREHTVDGLRRLKRAHEDRIRLVTGMRDDVETVVLRVVGGIRGAPVEVPATAVQAAVRRDGRFPRYRLAPAGEDIEVDLRPLTDEGDAAYWEAGRRIVENAAARIKDAQQSIGHLSVFALARIPLLVALGFFIDDKIPVEVYQRRRDGTGDLGWGFDPAAATVPFSCRQVHDGGGASRVALAVSVTASIVNDVAASARGAAIYEIAPATGRPARDLLTARASLDQFAIAYHGFLETVESAHPACQTIELFVAAPAAAAIQLGRGVMRDSQAALAVYDRDAHGVFNSALTLRRPTARR